MGGSSGSPLLQQAIDTLHRAGQMPQGQYRDDLRQLGHRLLRLHRLGMRANVRITDYRANATEALVSSECSPLAVDKGPIPGRAIS
jgi:hypothetical protein